MKATTVPAKSLLSTLWVFILFNMMLRDLHQFLHPGFLDELRATHLSEEVVLVFGIVLEIPILMVILSKVLRNRLNTWANTIAVGLTFLGILYTLTRANMDDIFFALVQILALIAILRIALKLPKEDSRQKFGEADRKKDGALLPK